MPARKLNSDYYSSDSTARKLEQIEIKKLNTNTNNRRVGKVKLEKKVKTNPIKAIALIFSIFSLSLVLTYRFNIINEKNLEAQSLKKQLSTAESSLATAQIEVEQNTDLNKIEAYAKQKLGMQKPDKNQTVYVDTSKELGVSNVEENKSVFDSIIGKVKDVIQNIFNKHE